MSVARLCEGAHTGARSGKRGNSSLKGVLINCGRKVARPRGRKRKSQGWQKSGQKIGPDTRRKAEDKPLPKIAQMCRLVYTVVELAVLGA